MTTNRRVVSSFCLGLLLYLAIEALLFRSHLYRRVLLASSSTGSLEMVLDAERNRPFRHPNQVLALGDSRMALRTYIANSLNTGYTYGFAGIAGTLPRVWYYLLRDVDPTGNRYSAILLPVENYDDEDWEDIANRSTDLNFLLYRLRYGDLAEFAGSYPTLESKFLAARGILLRGFVLKADFQDFLASPSARVKMADAQISQWYSAQQYYYGSDKTMDGLSIDWLELKAIYPAQLKKAERDTIDGALLRGTIEQTGKRAAYMRKWFGKIAEAYRGKRTTLLFYRMPRGPLVRPVNPSTYKTHSIRELARLPNVILLDENLLNELERPEYFMDGMHLNGEGCRRFTLILTAEVKRVLGN